MQTATTSRSAAPAKPALNGHPKPDATSSTGKLRRRPAMVLLSVGLVVLGAMLGVAIWILSSSSVEVVVARAQIDRGSVITADDLAVARVAVDPSIPVVPAGQLDALVGQRAASDVAAGTLLSPTEVTDELVPATGESVVGVALSTGQLPAELNRPGFSGGRVLPGPAGPGGFL